MGFGYYQRSPESVQADNGRYYDFKRIAERYETTKPLRGKRLVQNIRPHGQRERDWERIIKVDDNEYYLTNNAYAYRTNQGESINRAITFKRDDEGNETIIVHTPRICWGDENNRKRLDPKTLSTPSTHFFYRYNLPQGLTLTKHYTKTYLEVRNTDGNVPERLNFSYYTLEKGDVTVVRKQGEKYFKPLVVHREVKRKLDRTKTKAIREELKDFIEYVRVMLPLAEAKRYSMYTSPMTYAMKSSEDNVYMSGELSEECFGKGWRGLFTGEPTELWFKLVQYYKQSCMRDVWDSETRTYINIEVTPERVRNAIANEVFRHEKPIKEEEVALGTMTFDKYRNW